MKAVQFSVHSKRCRTQIFLVALLLLPAAIIGLPLTALAQNAPSGDTGNQASAGAALYKSTCSPCHQANRSGNAPDYPSLIGVSKRFTGQEITETIKGGLGKMPAFSDLSNDEIAAIVKFLQTADEAAQAPRN